MVIASVDVGGTLAKIVIYIPHTEIFTDEKSHELLKRVMREGSGLLDEELTMHLCDGILYFMKILSDRVPSVMRALAKRNVRTSSKDVLGEKFLPKNISLFSTGGGSHKYQELFDNSFQDVYRHDELECLVRGIRKMFSRRGECFSLANIHFGGAKGIEREIIESSPEDITAQDECLVVNIGSGVSFLHCSKGATSFVRVGGSSLGGSTFLGLTSLLTGVDNFDQAIDMASKGDSAKVDMLVRDIYGEKKEIYGLKETTLASSFGKMISRKSRLAAKKQDLALSTLIMCSMNVAALAHLHAKNTGAKHIVFTGSFLARSTVSSYHKHHKLANHLHKRNTIAMRTLAYAVSFWTKGSRKAVFFQHDGFLGAIGALSFDTQVEENFQKRESRL